MAGTPSLIWMINGIDNPGTIFQIYTERENLYRRLSRPPPPPPLAVGCRIGRGGGCLMYQILILKRATFAMKLNLSAKKGHSEVTRKFHLEYSSLDKFL
jgi:hypothetical protein